MLSKIQLTLEPEKEIDLNYNASSLLHGVLMELIEPAYAQKLHISMLKPFSQSFQKTDGKFIWTINTLGKEAHDQIALPVFRSAFDSFNLKHKEKMVRIADKKIIKSISYDDFIKTVYLSNNLSRYIKLKFNTPTAFKSNGQYVFWPDSRFIFKNLMHKYDVNTDGYAVYSEEALEDICKNCKISAYRLKSTRFHLEAVRIPAFLGEITFEINGGQTLRSLLHLLLNYGEFSGVGIKSALGMGAAEIIPPPSKPAARHES